MTKVFLDMAVSLDGFTTGPSGEDGGLHNWYFDSTDDADNKTRQVIQELVNTTGAIVMGRRGYDMADQYDGFVDNTYNVPHFVVSHTTPNQPAKGNTSLTFVSEGIEQALEQAKTAAGTKDVCVSGGANIAQQYLHVGLLDEIQIHLVPILLGGGIRLFDNFDGQTVKLERIRVIESPGVTHLRYRILK